MAKYVFKDKVHGMTVETDSDNAAQMLRNNPNLQEVKAAKA